MVILLEVCSGESVILLVISHGGGAHSGSGDILGGRSDKEEPTHTTHTPHLLHTGGAVFFFTKKRSVFNPSA